MPSEFYSIGRSATASTAYANASQAALHALWLPVSSAPPKFVSEGGAYSTQHFTSAAFSAASTPEHCLKRRCDQVCDCLALFDSAAFRQVRTCSGDAVCIIADAVIFICGYEMANILDHIYRCFQTSLCFSRVRCSQDSDDLTCKLCIRICSSTVKALCVYNFAVSFLGSLIECGISNIIAVSCDQCRDLCSGFKFSCFAISADTFGIRRVARTCAGNGSLFMIKTSF